MSSQGTKYLLITGATGKQGRAVVSALLSLPSPSVFHILALTRNPDSSSAKALAARSPSQITLIKGDLTNCPAVFASASAATSGKPIWGVYSVQQTIIDGVTQEQEEAQGNGLIDCALAAGVTHFVFSSVERGGGDINTAKPTDVPHFISKHNIEAHLVAKTAEQANSMTYTVLRPVAFMDGLSPNFQGKMMATFLKTALSPGRKLQFIATSDIGHFAAQAFQNPKDPAYCNTAINLAGDEISFQDMNDVFRDTQGHDTPTTWSLLARLALWFLKEINVMFSWFEKEGFKADVEELRRLHPKLKSFRDWLQSESGWAANK